MKILHVIPFFTPSRGGSVVSTYSLSKHLAENGHDVTIFTTDFELDEDYIKSLDRIRVVPFHCIANIGMMLFSPGMKLQLKKEIRDFDIIHMHEFRSYQNVIAYHYAKKYNTAYILQPRGSIPILSKSKRKKIFDIVFGHAIVRNADKIIASSKIESNQYGDVFYDLDNEKIVRIPNGICLETFQNLPQKGAFKKKYSIKVDEKIILFLSRIHERKGADILIRAYSKLKNEFEEVKLVIAGPDAGYLDKLKLIVNNLNLDGDVLFPGPLYKKDKLEAYVDADVFVLPSKDRYESFGNVILEAAACGTPSVITNVCGISEWLDGDAAVIVKPEENALCQGISKILQNKCLRSYITEKAKKSALTLSWSEVAKITEEVYSEVA